MGRNWSGWTALWPVWAVGRVSLWSYGETPAWVSPRCSTRSLSDRARGRYCGVCGAPSESEVPSSGLSELGQPLLANLAGLPTRLCLVDDAQWLDAASADALLSAARRGLFVQLRTMVDRG